MKFFDGEPIERGHGLVEDFAIEALHLIAPLFVAPLLQEARHLGKQRGTFRTKCTCYGQICLVEGAVLGGEQIGIKLRLLLGRHFLGDLLDQAVYVRLPGAGGKNGRELLLQLHGNGVDVGLRHRRDQPAGLLPAAD